LPELKGRRVEDFTTEYTEDTEKSVTPRTPGTEILATDEHR
jgi:hypothetical protein